MADIESVRQQMMEELERKIRSDGRLGSIRNKIQNGDYSEAGQYGTRCGELLSEVIRQNMTEDLFQECDVNGLASMLLPVIEKETEYVSNAVSAAQRLQNQETGIGINPIKPDFDASQYYNIFGKMQAYNSYDEAAWLLDEPSTLDSLQVVDKTMKENAEFHYKSGLRTKVVRTIESDNPCEECETAAGEYYFPNVPDYVWYRHNGCRCEIRIETEKNGYDRGNTLRNTFTENQRRVSLSQKQNESNKDIYPGMKDITRRYLSEATPGRGNISYTDHYDSKKYENEDRVAKLLFKKIGGDITLLEPFNNKKRSDYFWNDAFWELKNCSSAKAVDAAVRTALKQIVELPGGIIIELDSSVNINDAKFVLNDRLKRSMHEYNSIDIIIIQNKSIKSVMNYSN